MVLIIVGLLIPLEHLVEPILLDYMSFMHSTVTTIQKKRRQLLRMFILFALVHLFITRSQHVFE